MKKIVIYLIILTLMSCTEDSKNLENSSKKDLTSEPVFEKYEGKIIYQIGRVQTLDTTCIGSDKPINNKEVILFNFDLDDNGKVKKSQLVKSEIISKANQSCIEALNRSSIDHSFKNFYNIKKLNGLGVVNHFIASDKDIFLNDSKDNMILDINNDKKPDYVDMCYSSEGVHFNIWDSSQKQQKLFHDYVYLDFETIYNCSEKDYEEK